MAMTVLCLRCYRRWPHGEQPDACPCQEIERAFEWGVLFIALTFFAILGSVGLILKYLS
jgi:hypothetical protein